MYISSMQGASSKIYEGTFKNRDIAVKVINKKYCAVDVSREINILSQLKYKNIILLFYAYTDNNYTHIALERMDYGILDSRQ